jgi:hypothetical protein
VPRAIEFSTSALPAILRLLAEKSPEVTLGSVLADPSLGGAARAMTLREFARALSVGPVGPASRIAARAGVAPRVAGPRIAARRPDAEPVATRRLADATREPRARAKEYDAAILVEILAAVGPVGTAAVRAKVGGTPAAFRAAIERLVAAGKVKASGSARAPRYRAG